MGKPNFSDEFKRDAMAQITERGYPANEARTGPGDRGARHPKKATAYFARDAK